MTSLPIATFQKVRNSTILDIFKARKFDK